MFDSRRNLSFRRGISILIGGQLNSFFAPRGGNLNDPTFKSSNAPGGYPEGVLKFRIDRRIMCLFSIQKREFTGTCIEFIC